MKGCKTLKFNLKELGIPSEFYSNEIKLEGSFLEDDTSIVYAFVAT
jgi:hypothetical protein